MTPQRAALPRRQPLLGSDRHALDGRVPRDPQPRAEHRREVGAGRSQPDHDDRARTLRERGGEGFAERHDVEMREVLRAEGGGDPRPPAGEIGRQPFGQRRPQRGGGVRVPGGVRRRQDADEEAVEGRVPPAPPRVKASEYP